MKRLLWLDDIRDPMDKCLNCMDHSPIGQDVEVYWVKSYKEFISWIEKNGLPDGICFDHDLGDDTKTKNKKKIPKSGLDCADWLVEYCEKNKLDLPSWGIQTMDIVGKLNIQSILNAYERKRK